MSRGRGTKKEMIENALPKEKEEESEEEKPRAPELKQEEETVIFKKTKYNQLTFQQILMDLLKYFKKQTQAAFEIVASYLSISVWTTLLLIHVILKEWHSHW